MFALRVLAGVSLLVLTFQVAHATPWEPKAPEARRYLDEGRAAFTKADYALAGALFGKSNDAEANLNAQWNAAQAHAAAGNWKIAGGYYDVLLADPTLPKERRPDVERRQLIAARFITAEYARDAHKWDDARSQYLTLLGDKSIGDRDRATATTKLDELARMRAEFEAAGKAVPPTDASRPPPTPRPAPTPPPSSPSRWSDTPALILCGVGLVGLGVGVGLEVSASGLDADAGEATDQATIKDLRDRASTRRTIGYVTLGVGAGLAIAGAIKFVLVPATAGSGVALDVRPSADGATLVLGGSF